MALTVAQIDTYIAALDSFLASSDSVYTTVASDGTTRSTMSRMEAARELLKWQMMRGRADGSQPMIARGVLRGLSGSPSR